MPLEVIDDNRVVAQHREVHTLLGSVVSPRKGFQNHPVTKLYLTDHLPCLIDYHGYTVREMERRGWTGHGTPVKPEVLYLGLKNTPSCGTWQDHVKKVVPSTGQYSLHGDMHDLIERWTNEGKGLRNRLAQGYVQSHSGGCSDPDCRRWADDLYLGYNQTFEEHSFNAVPLKIKGHSSLRGKLELAGA